MDEVGAGGTLGRVEEGEAAVGIQYMRKEETNK